MHILPRYSREHTATATPPLALWNCTRSVLLAHSVEVARSHTARNKGLLGRSELVAGHGLWIMPCRVIHTIGMNFAIDLVFLDRACRIQKLCHRVPAWRTAGCLRACSVVELSAGTLELSQVDVQDLVEFGP